jgi:hypothetical protein
MSEVEGSHSLNASLLGPDLDLDGFLFPAVCFGALPNGCVSFPATILVLVLRMCWVCYGLASAGVDMSCGLPVLVTRGQIMAFGPSPADQF